MRLRKSAASASGFDRLAARFLLCLYSTLNAGVAFCRWLLWPGSRPSSASAVCVYRIGNVGDTICAYPAISAIRQEYSRAKIVLLTSPGRRGLPGARDVFSGVSWIDEIVEYFPDEIRSARSLFQFLAKLRRYRFDVFIVLPNDVEKFRVVIRNMVFARMIGAKWAGGWTIGTILLAVQQQSELIVFPNEVERRLADLRRCGIAAPKAEFRLPVPGGTDDQIDSILAGANVPAGSRFIALAPGAKRPANRWPLERFAEVGCEMVKRGYHVLILGSASERNDSETIRRSIGEACTNLSGLTDIAGSLALLDRCCLLICNDSGLQHAASAVDTPCVAVFSARDMWGKWRPHHPRSIMLRKKVPCHTCFVHDCPNKGLCLTEITSMEVITAALEILNGAAPYGGAECSAAALVERVATSG